MSQGYTREQLIKMYGAPSSAPASPAPSAGVSGSPQGFTREQLIAQYGNPTDASGAALPKAPYQEGMYQALNKEADYSGGLISDINEAVQDFSRGVGKGAVRLVPNLIQGLTPDKMWGENSLFNSESDKAKAFREATTGNSFLQKAGATAFDVAPILASGGASGAITGATEGIASASRFAPILEKAGLAGKAARLATKVPGAVADTLVSNAIINKGEVSPSENIGGTALALALPSVLRRGKNIFDSLTMGAEEYAQKKADDIFKAATKKAGEEGYNAVTVGEVAQDKADFIDYVKGLITKKSQEKAINMADIKTPDDSVLDFIYRNVRALGKNVDGKIDTTDVSKAIKEGPIKEISDAIGKVFKADKTPVDVNSFFDTVRQRILAEGDRFGTTNTDLAALEEIRSGGNFINPRGKFSLKNVSKYRLYKESEAIRSDLKYEKQLDGMSTKMGDANKRVMRIYDDVLRGSVNGAEREVIDNGFATLTQYYDAKNVIDTLNGVKVPGPVKNSIVKSLGVATGGILGGAGTGGFVASQIGYNLAPKLNNLIGSAQFANTVGSRTTKKIAELVQRSEIQPILSNLEAEMFAAKNFSDFVKSAEKRSSELQKLRKNISKRLTTEMRREAADAKMSVKFNKDRIKVDNFLKQLYDESKLKNAKKQWNEIEAIRNRIEGGAKNLPLGLPQGTMVPGSASLNVPSGSPQLPGPGVFGNKLIDYIGR